MSEILLGDQFNDNFLSLSDRTVLENNSILKVLDEQYICIVQESLSDTLFFTIPFLIYSFFASFILSIMFLFPFSMFPFRFLVF